MEVKTEQLEGTPYTDGGGDVAEAPRETRKGESCWGDCEMPDYLTRHYQWAYLMRGAVWFFDHQPIINCILLGNYREIMSHALRMIDPARAGKTLQIASVYGELIPRLAHEIDDLHVIDVAPVQLEAAARKLEKVGAAVDLRRMNAEQMQYGTDTFDTAVMFLLLHEMPPEARVNTLRESMRVLREGGRLVIAEFGEDRARHFIHRFAPTRWLLTKSEPFLEDFWNSNLVELVEQSGTSVGKSVQLEEQVEVFGGFYRVMSFRVA